MKFKILLPLILLAGMTVVGCEKPSSGGGSSKYKVEITNKTELQAEWYAGPSSHRDLSVTLTPEANPLVELNNGNLTIKSSNTTVASVTGFQINALSEGTARINVSYHGAKDYVDITISHEQTIPEKYNVEHYGTAEDPLTNEEALSIAKNPLYEEGNEDLYVGGTILSFYHAPGSRTDGYVSWFLQPAEEGGEKFEIYKCKKLVDEKLVPLTDDDVWVNGYAIAHGKFTSYNGQYETSEAVFVSCEGNKPQPRVTLVKTFAEAFAYVQGLADGADTYDYFQVDCYVTKKDGENYFLTATKGEEITDVKANTIELYAVKNADAVAKLLKNAKITITMVLKNYHGQVENLFTVDATQINVLEEGEPWEAPVLDQLTVAEALAKIDAIDISGVTKDKTTLYAENEKMFEVTGIVVAKGTWSESYKNADFYIADAAGEATARLQVFRYADQGVFDSLVVDETTVKVTCKLAVYVRVTDGVPSVGGRETNAGPAAEIVGDKPEIEKLTVAEALAKIDAIDISGVTKDKTTLYAEGEKMFEVSGIVVAKGTWSESYKNADFYIADAAGEATARLQVFRYADQGVFDSLVVDETTVKVTCKLAVYVRVTDGVPSVGGRETNQNPTVTITGGGETPTLTGISVSPETQTVDVYEAAGTATFTVSPEPVTAPLGTVEWSFVDEHSTLTMENGVVAIPQDAVAEDGKLTVRIMATCGEFNDVATLIVTKDSSGGGEDEGLALADAGADFTSCTSSDKKMPDGCTWTYLTNNPSYPDPAFNTGGFKFSYVNQGLLSAKLVSSSKITVTINVGALNAKSSTDQPTDPTFTVYGLDADEAVLDTEVSGVVSAKGDVTITLEAEAMRYVKIMFTGFGWNGSKQCNIRVDTITLA